MNCDVQNEVDIYADVSGLGQVQFGMGMMRVGGIKMMKDYPGFFIFDLMGNEGTVYN